MNENFWLVIIGAVCLLVAALNIFLTLKFDKGLTKILKQIKRWHIYGFILAFIPTTVWFFILGFLDSAHVFDGVKAESLVGQILVNAGVLSFPAILFGSTALFSAYLENRFDKK
jgi:hypothetical protein